MAAKRSVDAALARLRELEDLPVTESQTAEIGKLLRSRSGVVAAKAARLARDKNLPELTPELVAVFERFLKNPIKSDPGCQAKCAAVEALTALQYESADLFVFGVHYVQKEPAWGRPVDTADKLRGLCAYALYAAGHPRLLFHLVELLQDPEPIARIAAIQVLGNTDNEAAELLLRMKAHQADEEPDVLGESLAALMRIAPHASISFVATFLEREDAAAIEAGFALGESRLAEACDLLIDARTRQIRASRDHLLLPIALTRQDKAFLYLLEVVAHEPPDAAETAVKALPVLAVDAGRVDQIAQAVGARGNPRLEAVFQKEFAAS